VAAIGEEFHFKIVTLDRDVGEAVSFPGIVVNQWVRVGHADVMYVQPGCRGLIRMYTLLRSVDRKTVLYLNSFFARRFSMLAVLMRRLNLCRPRSLVVAPRGEFSLGALRFKSLQKSAYIKISRWLGLFHGIIWHASNHFEAEDIRRQFVTPHIDLDDVVARLNSGRSSRISAIATASDIAGSILSPLRRARKTPGQLRAVFVSRFTRKKNLAGALTILAGVSGEVFFDLYGPVEDASYWDECQGLIAELPANIKVQYKGEVGHEQVGQVFADHDLFLFPTRGENFGHVIYEALAQGCPVLISDQTPWRNLQVEGVGWDLRLDEPERFRTVLQQCVDSDDEWHSALSRRAMNYAAKRASDPDIVHANRRLFQVASHWPGPNCPEASL
jgi:glycosyltransferase involved in cell wall biosynthesis